VSERASLARAAGDFFGSVLLFQAAPESERPSFGAFRSRLLELLDGFQKSAEARQSKPSELEEARFALVAWADEMVNWSGWKGATEWERDPLQLQLFSTRHAGVEFFEHLSKLGRDQAAALEVYFLCLALGFQGQYAGHEGDRHAVVQETLEKLRRSGRALDLASEKRITPTAYQLNIALQGRRSRLFRTLLLIAGASLLLFGTLWGVLWLLAGRVPLITGG